MLTEALTLPTTHRASHMPTQLITYGNVGALPPLLAASRLAVLTVGSLGDVIARWQLAVLRNNLRGQCLQSIEQLTP